MFRIEVGVQIITTVGKKKTDKEEGLRIKNQAVKVKVLLCLTLCDPMDYTLCGILQARILKRVAFPFPRTEPRSTALQVPHLLGKKKKNQAKDPLIFFSRGGLHY